MSTVVYNPTDKLGEKYKEDFVGHYMGVGIKIAAGEKVKLDDNKAKHLLNEFTPRGLVALNFGDEAEEKSKHGLDANRKFKIKQVNDFNYDNSKRKHIGLAYIWPTKKLELYAEELGIKLEGSYKVDDTQLLRTKQLEDENKALKEQMATMNETMNQILSRLNASAGPTIEEKKETDEILEEANKEEEITTPKKKRKYKKGKKHK